MKKDNIEKLFSSLEDFSKIPPDDLWKGIEERLDAPKKKKGLGYWWPIAASLVVGLGLLSTFYFHSDTVNPLLNVPLEHKKGVVNQPKQNAAVENETRIIENKKLKDSQDSRLSNSNSQEEKKHKHQEKTRQELANVNSNSKSVLSANKDAIVLVEQKSTAVAATKNENQTQAPIKEKVVFVNEKNNISEEKSIVEKQTADAKIKENLATVDLQENALASLVKEQEKKAKTPLLEDKWSLQVFAGVNSSQNVRNQKLLGSTIESQKGHSYGVKTNYKLNSRWAVSTGLKISELGQQVANVSYVSPATSLVNISKESLSSPQGKKGITTNSNYVFVSKNQEMAQSFLSSSFYEMGNLSQKVQYLEMPMEVSYAILNKGKAHIKMNTGGFVGRVISNEVLLDNTSIGENSDVNEVIFGTILSSTLQYELFKKTKVFIEPGMNYYTQPVQNQNFNQFQLIFNFGLNLSF